jgi:sec-independent protein translocase protein TatC
MEGPKGDEFTRGNRIPFLRHLEALRKHILRIVCSVVGISLFCFLFGIRWFTFSGISFPYPFPTLSDNISSMVFDRLAADLIPGDVELIMIHPIDAVLTNLQLSFFIGFSIGMIVIAREMAAFLSPALKEKEKRLVVRFSIPALLLFISGCLFSYFLITPFTFAFLYEFGSAMGIQKMLVVTEFVSFLIIMILGFGLIFELPVLMFALTRIGIVTPDFWKRHWRISLLAMIIVAGVITPDTTGITQIIVVIPMAILYGIGYLISKRA